MDIQQHQYGPESGHVSVIVISELPRTSSSSPWQAKNADPACRTSQRLLGQRLPNAAPVVSRSSRGLAQQPPSTKRSFALKT